MKTLILIFILSLISFPQYRENSLPIQDYTYDTSEYHLKTHEMNMCQYFSMQSLMYQETIRFDQKNEIGYVRENHWNSIGYNGKRQLTSFMAVMCGNANKNYKYPITIKSMETGKTMATFIVPKKELRKKAKRNYYDSLFPE